MKLFTFLGMLLISVVATAQTSQLKPADCGGSVSSFGEIFSCTGVAGATDYEFTFDPQGVGATVVFERPYHTMTLAYASLYAFNAVYDVTIRAKVAGVYGAVGNVCTLTGPTGVPATQVVAASCGNTLPNFSAPIYCNGVAGATSYEFEFKNTTTNVVTEDANPWIWNSLGNAGLFDIGATYEVRARA